MGFFNRNKNTGKPRETMVDNNRQGVVKIPSIIKPVQDNKGNFYMEFYDPEASFRKFYDTTRLVIKGQPYNIQGHQVYDCAVSWYGESDCEMVREGKRIGRKYDYSEVLAEIDLGLLQSDSSYCSVVMKKLLDKQRVEKYLRDGLEEQPEHPCGMYIGGVQKTEKGYRKIFSKTVGEASHRSEIMIKKRNQYREMKEAKRQAYIKSKKDEISRLQKEIDEMER